MIPPSNARIYTSHTCTHAFYAKTCDRSHALEDLFLRIQMKRPKNDAGGDGRRAKRPPRRKQSRPSGSNNNQQQVTEMLKVCLQKVCELQSDLQRSEDHEDDPEAAGYAACAMETLRFLSREGLPSDHPIVKSLRERLLNDSD